MKLRNPLLVLFFSSPVYSWEVDRRCPGVERRLKTSKRPVLIYPTSDFDSNSTVSSIRLEDELEEILTEKARHLRGKEDENNDRGRELEIDSEFEEEADIRFLEERQLMGDDRHFNLKMYWQKGFCWQEEYDIHRKWCMQCEGNTCGVNDILWLQDCRNIPEQKFQWLPDSKNDDAGRIKTSTENLCLQRISSNFYKLKRCSSSRLQLFKGFRRNRPFEIKPIHDNSKCINQHHHPKWYEEIYTTDCKLARKYFTNKWEVYFEEDQSTPELGSGPQLDRDIIECSSDRKCGVCEGDCDRDSDCKGKLECYQRAKHNPWDIVYGCRGYGRKGVDYCMDPYARTSDSNNNNDNEEEEEVEEENDGSEINSGRVRLDPKVINCRQTKQCDRCQGDCDNDRDCKGDLVCFQKDRGFSGPIPGCRNTDRSRTDYCVDPRDL